MTGDLKKYLGAYLKESNPSPLKRSSYTPSLVSLEVTWLSFDAEIIKNILFYLITHMCNSNRCFTSLFPFSCAGKPAFHLFPKTFKCKRSKKSAPNKTCIHLLHYHRAVLLNCFLSPVTGSSLFKSRSFPAVGGLPSAIAGK